MPKTVKKQMARKRAAQNASRRQSLIDERKAEGRARLEENKAKREADLKQSIADSSKKNRLKTMKKGGRFPDLTGDGKVTFADILKGRGVKKAGKGMKYEGGGKLDRGGNATKEYKKQKGKEAKHYRKGMIAKTKAGESIHRTMRKRAARKADAVSGKFKDSNEKSNYTYASFKNGGKKAMYGMKHKNK